VTLGGYEQAVPANTRWSRLDVVGILALVGTGALFGAQFAPVFLLYGGDWFDSVSMWRVSKVIALTLFLSLSGVAWWPLVARTRASWHVALLTSAVIYTAVLLIVARDQALPRGASVWPHPLGCSFLILALGCLIAEWLLLRKPVDGATKVPQSPHSAD
jgi:hypothetical protein